MRNRYCVPRIPKGYVDGMSLYEYVGSNPLVRNDPTGKAYSWPMTAAGGAAGAVGGLCYGVVSEGIDALQGQGFEWREVGKATAVGTVGGLAIGAVSGAIAGDPSAAAVGTMILAGAAGGAAKAVADAAWDAAFEKECPDMMTGDYPGDDGGRGEPSFPEDQPPPRIIVEHGPTEAYRRNLRGDLVGP
jgi:hypothetical protein